MHTHINVAQDAAAVNAAAAGIARSATDLDASRARAGLTQVLPCLWPAFPTAAYSSPPPPPIFFFLPMAQTLQEPLQATHTSIRQALQLSKHAASALPERVPALLPTAHLPTVPLAVGASDIDAVWRTTLLAALAAAHARITTAAPAAGPSSMRGATVTAPTPASVLTALAAEEMALAQRIVRMQQQAITRHAELQEALRRHEVHPVAE